jgi:error-prone DNA polymerase
MSEEAHKDPVRLEHAPFYAELAAATNYSFLRGASHPSDMVARALELGMSGIGIADRNTVAGVVRAHAALKEARAKAMATGLPDPDFRLVVGARLVFADGTPDILAYPATRFGWGRLTRLLTQGNRRAEKGACILTLDDLLGHNEDLLLIGHPVPGARASAANSAVCYCWASPRSIRPGIDAAVRALHLRGAREPPDIDVDFEHERREEVIQYIYAAMAATAPAWPPP